MPRNFLWLHEEEVNARAASAQASRRLAAQLADLATRIQRFVFRSKQTDKCAVAKPEVRVANQYAVAIMQAQARPRNHSSMLCARLDEQRLIAQCLWQRPLAPKTWASVAAWTGAGYRSATPLDADQQHDHSIQHSEQRKEQ